MSAPTGGPEGEAWWPVTPFQAWLFLQQRLDAATHAYDVAGAARFPAPVELAPFTEAVARLSARHPMLRARFEQGPEGVRQQILPHPPSALRIHPEDVEAEEDAAARLARGRPPFELGRAPLFEVHLRPGPRSFVYIRMHHVIADLWSSSIVVAELARTYRALRLGEPLVLPPLDRQYDAYVRFLEAEQVGEEAEARWEYWTRALGPPLTPVQLPFARRGAAADGAPLAGETVFEALDAALGAAVLTTAARAETSAFVLLLSAFQLVLALETGASRVPIALPVHGRTRRWMQPLVGTFINTLIVAPELDLEGTVGAALGTARAGFFAALRHGALPITSLSTRLGTARTRDLSQVQFDFQHLGHSELDAVMTGANAELVRLPGFRQQEGQVALQLEVQPMADGGYELRFKFQPEVYPRAEIQRLAERYRALVAVICEDLDRPVRGLAAALEQALSAQRVDALPDAEVERLLRAMMDQPPE